MSDAPTPTGPEWLARFADLLGTDAPDEAMLTTLLDLAGAAAHQSERIAAPIACYLAGRTGTDPARALELARSLADESSTT